MFILSKLVTLQAASHVIIHFRLAKPVELYTIY